MKYIKEQATNAEFEDEQYELEEKNAQIEELEHFLGLLFKNAGIESYDVEAEGLNFHIYVMLSKVESMTNIIKALEVVKKLHTDVLVNYKIEFDLWETKTGQPLLTFSFFVEGYEKDDDMDEDADDWGALDNEEYKKRLDELTRSKNSPF